MGHWQEKHDTDEQERVTITNGATSVYHVYTYEFFPEALELLSQEINKGSFHKPIKLRVEGMNGVRAALDAVQKKRLTDIYELYLHDYQYGLDYSEVAQMLSKCLKNGSLENLENIDFSCNQKDEVNGVILSALATGRAPKLKNITLFGDCDASTREKLAQAIADGKLPKLSGLKDVCGNILFPLNDHCRILRIPEEFSDRSNKHIMEFLQERRTYGEVQLSTAKVIVAGPTNVGKTCLVHCLKGNDFEPDPGSTNTVDVRKMKVDGGLNLLYYDFGGQRVYITTHHLLLKTSAVFLVLWDRQEETGGDAAVHHYARDVLDANPRAKLIFVTTKGDSEGQRPLSAAEQSDLKDRYGESFRGYYHVSAKANTGIDKLLAAIKSAAGFADVLMPKPYAKMRKSLLKHRRDRLTWKSLTKLWKPCDEWYVTRRKWNTMLRKEKIEGRARICLASRLFHHMGDIVPLSSGHIVLDPSVLVGVLSRVVTADDDYTENARGGYLRHDELAEVWSLYPKELHKGFLELIHDIDIGFPVRDHSQNYEATLIPAMLTESAGVEIRQGLEELSENFPDFKPGPEIVVEMSNLSNQLWTKLLVMLRDVVVLGGWSENGCITIHVVNGSDETDDVESFGAVLWHSKKRQVSIVTFGRSPIEVQFLRCRSLNALRVTLKDFPGVYIEHLYIKSSVDDSVSSWMEQWSEEALFQLPLDTATFENRGASDVAEWVLELRKETGHNNDSALKYFVEMLQKDSASDDVLCYLLLKHQEEMLSNGCQRGRLRLNALWLIYDTKDGRIAYPFCPHLCRGRVRVKDIWNGEAPLCRVSDIDLHQLSSAQIEVKTLIERILKKLDVGPPRNAAEFRGILWMKCEPNFDFMIKEKDSEMFVPVAFDGFFIYVYKSDKPFFINQYQVDAIKNLTEKAKRSISESRKNLFNICRKTQMSTAILEKESLPDETETPSVSPLSLENQHEPLKHTYEGKDHKRKSKNTLLQLPNHREEDVGELSHVYVGDPGAKWPMSCSHYVFLSHTGQDNVKAEIARPTHWFLTNVVGVQAFLDESDAERGSTKMEALTPPAYMCTHALVILSPSFRQRKFCVQELNTFMERWRRRDGICVLPALWLMDSLKGYHPDVNDLIWIPNARTKYPVDYFVKILWPALLRKLGHPAMTTEVLERHLLTYVESTRGGIHEIPSFLETFVARRQSQQGSH